MIRPALGVSTATGDRAAVARDAFHARVADELDPLGLEGPAQGLAERRLIASKECGAGHDRDPAAEAGEHLGQLHRDVVPSGAYP
jgi:hypothetical protein